MCTLFNVLAGIATFFGSPTVSNAHEIITHFDTYECTQALDRIPNVSDQTDDECSPKPQTEDGMLDINKMSTEQMKLFRYTKLCEVFSNNDEEELLTWTPITIDKFILRRRDPKDIHICV